jgi:hypothetical protein
VIMMMIVTFAQYFLLNYLLKISSVYNESLTMTTNIRNLA